MRGARVASTAAAATATTGVVVAATLLRALASCSEFSDGTPPPTDSDGAMNEAGIADDATATSDGGGPAEPELDATTAAATLIVTNEPKLGRIVVGDARVYYTQAVTGGSIKRISKSAPTPLAEVFQDGGAPADIALFGSTLFATSTTNDKIVALDTDKVAGTLTASVKGPGALAVDGMAVVFLETSAPNAGAYALPLSLAGSPMELATGNQATALAMDGESIYAAFGQHVRRLTRPGGSPSVVSVDLGAPVTVIEVAGNKLYLGSGSHVMTLPIAFTSTVMPTPIHDYGGGEEVTAIRASDPHVFVATQGPTYGGTVHSLPAGGGPAAVITRFSDAFCKLPDMAIDDTSIYFLCNAAGGVGSVWRVARPAP